MCIRLLQLYQGDAKSLEYFINQISQNIDWIIANLWILKKILKIF